MLFKFCYDYIKAQLKYALINVRTYVILAFAEEHLGDKAFYNKLVEEGLMWHHIAKRKFRSPIKWLQFLISFTFSCLIHVIYILLDCIFALPALALSGLFQCYKRLQQQHDPITLEALLVDASNLHVFLVGIPRLFALGIIGFLRNPIEVVLSPLNRVLHPFRTISGIHRFWAVSALVAFVGIGIGMNFLLGFPFFSYTSVLLFFPTLIAIIASAAGHAVLEAICATITAFNMTGFIVNYFEHGREFEQDQAARIRDEPLPVEPPVMDDINIFTQITEQLKEATRYNWLPTIYHEQINGQFYLEPEKKQLRSIEDHQISPDQIVHYNWHKFFDWPLSLKPTKTVIPQLAESFKLSIESRAGSPEAVAQSPVLTN